MRKLGISIYPERASSVAWIEYLDLAAKYGFARVFTCLISAAGDKERILKDFAEITHHAKKLGMETIADVSPSVFKELNINYNELSFFHKLQLSGLRLDEGFSGMEESIMTQNPYDISIEINMSNGTKYLDNILSYKPNKEKLIGCHNFYPHRYTGLSREHLLKCSRQFKEQGIRTAAFVSSNAAEFGPWPGKEGLCTLEQHRSLPLEIQVKDLFNTELIDDVIIANAFASEEELRSLSRLDRNILTLNVELEKNIQDVYRKIIQEELHFNRGDVSEYLIRSTQSRIKYKGCDLPLFNPVDIKRGDVLIESALYERYAGEMQIALMDMENCGKTNVAGRIIPEEVFLLNYIQPWQKFKLIDVHRSSC